MYLFAEEGGHALGACYRGAAATGVRDVGPAGDGAVSGAVPPLRHQPQGRLPMVSSVWRSRGGWPAGSLPPAPPDAPAAGGAHPAGDRGAPPGASLLGSPQAPPAAPEPVPPPAASHQLHHRDPASARADWSGLPCGSAALGALRTPGTQQSLADGLQGARGDAGSHPARAERAR